MEPGLKELIKKIKESNPRGGSHKDEIAVMKAMLNDASYEVEVYDNKGKVGTFKPYDNARKNVVNVLTKTGMNKSEATTIAENYSYSSSEAENFVAISKEFVNTYTDSGRMLNLGKRENYSASLRKKEIPAKERKYFTKDEKGNTVTKIAKIPAHVSLKSTSKCPTHKKQK